MVDQGDYDQRFSMFFFFQAEDGIRDLVRSRGLGDVYKRQRVHVPTAALLLLPRVTRVWCRPP